MQEQTSTQALDSPNVAPYPVPECYGRMAAKDDDECGVCAVAAACVTISGATPESKARAETFDTETGEVHGQLIFGLSVPVLTQRKGADPLKTDEAGFNRHYWTFGPGDRLTAQEKDGQIVVALKEGWRAE